MKKILLFAIASLALTGCGSSDSPVSLDKYQTTVTPSAPAEQPGTATDAASSPSLAFGLPDLKSPQPVPVKRPPTQPPIVAQPSEQKVISDSIKNPIVAQQPVLYNLNSFPDLNILSVQNAQRGRFEYLYNATYDISQMSDVEWNRIFPGTPKLLGPSMSTQWDALTALKEKELGLDDLKRQYQILKIEGSPDSGNQEAILQNKIQQALDELQFWQPYLRAEAEETYDTVSRIVDSNYWSSPAHQAAKRYSCCKICSTGKACGDTCITRADICHVGLSCACDN